MSMKMLNDISKVYLEKVAVAEGKKAKPDYLDFDKDGNKKESMKKALKDKEVSEAVKGQDTEMRRAASAERRSGDRRLPPSKGKEFAKYKSNQISYVDKKTKGRHLPGYTYGEALEVDLKKREEANKKAIKDMKKTKAHQDMVATVRKKFDEEKKSNDGNLANNYPPYDKVTRGDVIAGRLGKDQMGGKKKVKEGFSNWRQDLAEVVDEIEDNKKIKEKKVDNKIVINPDFKEAVEQLGGQLIEMVELDEETPVERIDRISKEKVAQQAASAKAEKERKAASAAKFQEFKKSHIAGGGTPVSAIDAWQKQKMKKEEVEQVDEKMNLPKADMGDVIKDFYKSKAPQFRGKSKEKRREMAIAAKLTAERGGKRLGEQMDDENKIDTAAERQRFANIKMMQQKQQQLQKQKLNLQRQGRLPLSTEEVELIDERRKEEKGTPRKPRDRAFELVAKSMGASRMGVQPRGEKKVPGEKKPSTHMTPAQKVAKRRAIKQQGQDNMSSRFD